MDLNFEKVKTLDADLENFINKNIFFKSISFMNQENIFKHKSLQKYFNTLISYLYKGAAKVEQNFRLSNCKKNSILLKILNNKNKKYVRLEIKK